MIAKSTYSEIMGLYNEDYESAQNILSSFWQSEGELDIAYSKFKSINAL